MPPDDERGRVALLPAVTPKGAVLAPRLGPYLLDGQIGQGVIGTVFQARAPGSDRDVAVKVFHESIAGDAGLCRTLLREASAARVIDHPNVARVLAVASPSSPSPFVCREWVHGVSVDHAMREGVRTTKRIVEVLCQVLSGLAEGHRRGVVHGHVCPSNVLVCRSSQGAEHVRLCDFGLARLLPLPEGRPPSAYAAPERRTGKRLDGRADVFGVGVLLFELWTGKVAPRAHRAPEEGPALDFSSLRPPMPTALALVGARATAQARDRRFPSPLAMARALRQTLELLGPRVDLPIESADTSSLGADPGTAASERITMPGDQLRSKTKLWLGILLVALASGALALYAGTR